LKDELVQHFVVRLGRREQSTEESGDLFLYDRTKLGNLGLVEESMEGAPVLSPVISVRHCGEVPSHACPIKGLSFMSPVWKSDPHFDDGRLYPVRVIRRPGGQEVVNGVKAVQNHEILAHRMEVNHIA
jgi:hypothetical protein